MDLRKRNKPMTYHTHPAETALEFEIQSTLLWH